MKKITSIFLLICLMFSQINVSAFEMEYYGLIKNENLILPGAKIPAVKGGSLIVEAEDIEYSQEAAVISEPDASGTLALLSTATAYAGTADEVKNIEMHFKAEIPEEETGDYYLWMRVKCTNSGNYSFWEKYSGVANYKVRYVKVNPNYQWVQVAKGSYGDEVFEYMIKHRDPGFKIDKFVLTQDATYAPSGKDDLPTMENAEEISYDAPPFYPPANTHPRLLASEDIIPNLKENAKHPALSAMYNQVAYRANVEMDCNLPDKGGQNNVDLALAFNLQCRAYMYLLGEADDDHARETVAHTRDFLNSLIWDRSVGDITRSMGTAISAAAFVYDWCYDVLTDEDKEDIIKGMKRTMRQMEIGYPPKTYEIFAGHGGEGEVYYYQLACAIAVFDEDPEMYNYVAGLLFQHMFDARKLFNESGNHTAGSSYGPVRLSWEQLGAIIFDRMGVKDVTGNNVDKPSMRWIYDRLPHGFWFEDGDSYLNITTSLGPSYNFTAYPAFLYGSYYNDNQYLRGEYIRELALKKYSAGATHYDNGILTLLTLDPGNGYAYPDDEGKELPLSYFTSYPLTAGFMRTSWKEGIDSETAMVFMNGQEKLVGDHDHEHSDIGNFQIYYKGVLTGHGGTYAGQNGGWGAEHNYNYYRRTISQNCLTVFDPNEKFTVEWFGDKEFSNDGGQMFEKNTNFLPEFLSHPDQAKTESKYAGPNSETPEFTYLKTDLTNAYSDKIEGYTRSMVAMNLFNTDYPLAFICYDNVTSSDKNFKKTWNLQAISEPEIEGNQTVIKRSGYGHSGELVVNTLLPEGNNMVISTVGGEGFESYVNGVNYPNPDKPGQDHEQCDWRVEVSPKNASESDLFLNAMYVTDTNKNLPGLPMFKEDMAGFTGVTVMDRTVLFSKSRELNSAPISINVRNNGYDTMCVLVTDLESGVWKVGGNGTNLVLEVKQEENTLYARLAPGSYTISKADGETPQKISYKRDERVERVGDVYVYDGTRRLFEYTQHPTVLKDSVPYLSEADMNKNGITVQRAGNEITITGQGHTKVLTLGSNACIADGVTATLAGAPFEKNGILYISATDNAEMFTRTFAYDSLARIIKLTKKPELTKFSYVFDVEKVAEPVSYMESSNDGNTPENLFDYNYDTRWSAEGGNEYIIIDYGIKTKFDKILLSVYDGKSRGMIFDIYVSDDQETFELVYSGQTSGTSNELESFPMDVSGRYIKLQAHGNTVDKWNSYTEIIALKK